MKLKPKGLGANPKQMVILGVLVLVLVVVYFMQSGSGEPAVVRTVPRQTTSQPVIAPQPTSPRSTGPKSRPRGRGGNSEEFHPTMTPPDGFDVTKVDPTLRRDLLARLRGVGDVGGSRSLFEFYVPPPPPPPPQPPIVPRDPPKVDNSKSSAPPPPPPAKPKTKPDFKYFGFWGNPKNLREGLFIDGNGEDTWHPKVGDMVKKRWKVVKLTSTTAELDDTVEKDNRQTLKIEARTDQ